MTKLEEGIKEFLPYWEEFKAQYKGAIVEWEWEDFDEGELLVLMHFGTTSKCQNPDEAEMQRDVAEILDIETDQVTVEASFSQAPVPKGGPSSSTGSLTAPYKPSGWYADVIIDLW